MEKRGMIFLGVFVFVFSLSGVFAWADNTSLYQEVDGCNLLNTTGATYVLTGNVESTGTCFTVSAQNITLDCNGSWINYSIGGAGSTYGIYTNQFNTTIKNCNILDGNWGSSQTTRYGIYFNVNHNSTLFNIFVNVSKSRAIYIFSSFNNNLTNINTISNISQGLYLSSILNNNLLNVNASSNTNYGIYFYSNERNTLSNVSASSNLNSDFYFDVSDSYDCKNAFNNVTGKDGKQIVYIYELPVNIDNFDGSKLIMCNVTFSNITNSNFTGGGIQLHYSNYNSLSNLNIISNTSTGINLEDSSSNNIFSNLSSSSNTDYGMYISSSPNNTLFNVHLSSENKEDLSFHASSIDNCKNIFNNVTGKDGKQIVYINELPVNIDNFEGSRLIMCNVNFSNITNSNFTRQGINAYYSNKNSFSNIIAMGNISRGIYLYDSSNSTFSNVNGSSNTYDGICMASFSNNNNFSNVIGSSKTSHGIYLYYSSKNIFSNAIGNSNNSRGMLIDSSSNNTFSNITVISNISTALYFSFNSDFNSIINSTLISLNKNGTLLYFASASNSNIFYWNNFTETSGYYVQDLNGANYFNTTINGKSEGNIWNDVMNGSVNILGNINSSAYPSLYIGKYGTGYPYKNTTSFGKLSGNVVDYAPLTNLLYIDTTPPYFTLIPENSSLFYGNESLLVQFTAEDETAFQGYSVNDTRFSINQTGFLSNATSLAVGNYQINVTINDSSNNINWTIYSIELNKSNYYDCGVYFNTPSPVTYPSNFIVYTNCSSAYTLYLNGTSISNSTTINSGVDHYNLTVQRTDTANYTYITDIQFFTVNQNTEECQVLFNATSPLDYPATFLVWANCSSDFTLYRNGTIISNNSEQSLIAGAYNFSFSRTDVSNYTYNYNETQFIVLPDTTSPTYSSVSHSSTYVGQSSTFSVYIDDNISLHSNGQYTFSTNNSGEWVNESAVNFSSTPSWANVSETLNSTVGMIVGYMWYFEDNAGNENSTSIYVLTTTAVPVVDPPSPGGGSSTSTQTQNNYQLGREFLEQGEQFQLRRNSEISFRHREQSHTFTLNSFTSSSCKITIESDPIIATLEKDVAQEFDIDEDGVKDIEVVYQGVEGRDALVVVSKLVLVSGESEVYVNQEGGEVQETGSNEISTDELFGADGSTSSDVEKTRTKTKHPLQTVLISLIVMGAIIGGLYAIGKNEKKKKDHYLGFFDK